MHPDISIVIVNWNTRELTLACLESLCAALEAYRSEVWVVDNASHDGSVAAIRAAYPQVKLIENNQNVGFAAANNQALQQANGRYLFLLNSDTLCKAGALSRLIHYADQHPQIAMLGPKLLNADGSFQPSFADFPNFANELLSVSGIGGSSARATPATPNTMRNKRSASITLPEPQCCCAANGSNG
jgi:N-acetylglucosaminyl-diphospho-decaprenol L-rhamnosyltransferase